MLKSNLCDYIDVYTLDKGTVKIANTAGTGGAADNGDINVIFKNFAPFNDSISEINKTELDNAKDINVAMPIYNLIEHNGNYPIL